MTKKLLYIVEYFIIFPIVIGYVSLTTMSTIDFYATESFFENVTGLDASMFYTSSDYEYPNDYVAVFFDGVLYKILLAGSLVFAIIGTIVLTRRRSFLSAMGLFVAFIIPREKIYWGRIIDKQTQKIVPFATIRLIDTRTNKILNETISDTDGRYRINLTSNAQDYELVVAASGYAKKYLKPDERFKKGDVFDITGDIYIEKTNSENKNFINILSYNKPFIVNAIRNSVYICSIILVIVYVYYAYLFPGSYYGIIQMIMYVFSFSWNTWVIFFNNKPKGNIVDSFYKKPIKAVFIQLFNDESLLETKTTDGVNPPRFNVKPGSYRVKLAKNHFKSESTRDDVFIAVNIDSSGFLQENIVMVQTEEESGESSINPFGN